MKPRVHGYAYLYLLFAIALLAIAVTGIASLDLLARRQAEEHELLRIGHEFRTALFSYRQAHPSRQFPLELKDLLEDRRGGALRRHLRRLYVDPVTRQAEWGVIRQAGQIIGVHSLSERTPMKIANFEPEDAGFDGAQTYAEWTFLTTEPSAAPMVPTQNAPGPPSAPTIRR
ncbi:type II secretion system protein [Xanthomonas arboricola]|uniref:type II secretion system protein n=1 Tax=Xanthomonas arboricola TaxID=56448 RepID=UPI0011B07DBA|nr:type II secretion system protein [Xanthomonas arboricola]CAD7377098.1 type II secretion system protein [Xanthomonas arboricola]CAG2084772.1 type II secretion system protein [Xanthomonas arboricola pv. juglandis]